MESFTKKYRFENFISEFDAFLKANLPLYIDQMNTDYAALPLAKPVSAAYFFQSITDTEVPYSIFVFYGETSTATSASGPVQRRLYELQVAIILANSNELNGVMGTRLLRYRDCLEACINEGWNKVNKRVKIEVAGISPFPFALTNQDATHAGIGVTVTLEII